MRSNDHTQMQAQQNQTQMMWRMSEEAGRMSGGDEKEMDVSDPGDAQEKEADSIAKTVSDGGQADVSNLSAPAVQAKGEEGGPTPNSNLQTTLDSSKGGGEALKEQTRSEMEGKMNADLGAVKVHTDSKAHDMSESINAKAFTHGQDVYFKKGNYNTDSKEGKELLTHELVHTQQQKNGVSRKIQRLQDPVGLYAGSAISYNAFSSLDRYNDDPKGGKVQGSNYWYKKLNDLYKIRLGYAPGVYQSSYDRFIANLDEENAVLSKAWELKPGKVPLDGDPLIEKPVMVAASKENNGVKEQYLAHYMLEYSFNSTDKKPELKVMFDKEIPSAASKTDRTSADMSAAVDPAINSELELAYSFGFPEKNNLPAYFNLHPEVKQALRVFLQEKVALAKKNNVREGIQQVITCNENYEKEVEGKTEKAARPLEIFVQGIAHQTEGIKSLQLTYSVAADNVLNDQYNKKDEIDYEAEKHYTDNPLDPERVIFNGLEKITDKSERLLAKKVGFDLFKSTVTKEGVTSKRYRDKEVDQIIPVTNGAGTDYYYYTYVIEQADKDNNVEITVKRIGKKGDAVIGDPSLLSITDIFGYGVHAYNNKKEETPAALLDWLMLRYGKVIQRAEIEAATVQEITAKTDALLNARADKTGWFLNAYTVTVKGKDSGKGFLTSKAGLTATEAAGTKDFEPQELKLLEQAFQKMPKSQVNLLSGFSIIRQDANHEKKYAKMDLGGITRPDSKSITYYDGAFKDRMEDKVTLREKSSFIGGENGVSHGALDTLNHEMGHVVAKKTFEGYEKNTETLFNEFYKARKIDPVTDYSRDKSDQSLHSPESEFFPEAFYIFLNDPEWLLTNLTPVYFWFFWLENKGAPPASKKIDSLVDAWTALKAANGGQPALEHSGALVTIWQAYVNEYKTFPAAGAPADAVAGLQLEFFAKNNYLHGEAEAKQLIEALNTFQAANGKAFPTREQIKTLVNEMK